MRIIRRAIHKGAFFSIWQEARSDQHGFHVRADLFGPVRRPTRCAYTTEGEAVTAAHAVIDGLTKRL